MNLLILFLAFTFQLSSQDSLSIKTSAQCGSCKQRLESRLTKVKGIQTVVLNLDTKMLNIAYEKSIISSIDIKTKVTEIGYDADELPAKKAAYKRLPACCRKDYQGEHH